MVIGNKKLTIQDFSRIVFKDDKIRIDETAKEKVEKSYTFLKKFSKGKVIYGINTGLGPMAQYKINEADQKQLQYNLIRSHASGSGKKLPDSHVKALMLARLSTLSQAYSGVHPEVIDLLIRFINLNIFPHIPQHGGVGASGDLIQLAHLALALIGEGDVTYQQKQIPAYKTLALHDLRPIAMHIREGLALINGTSAMSGIGMINAIYAEKLINWSVLASTFINEIVNSFDDHYSDGLNKVKLHPGQQKIATAMQNILFDSQLIKKRENYFYNGTIQTDFFNNKVQEYYSLRCVPQVLGPVYDTWLHAVHVLENEVNSANDNPIIDAQQQNVYHGGNFHGDYVALEMDKLRIAITKLSMLAERQLNFIVNDKLNQKLPPFVNLGKPGLNFGVQGMQFTAVSTTAENQTLSFPMYVHSIPNNNDNQDIVSMGTNAAQLTAKVIDNSFEIVAIELITLVQAVDQLNISKKLSSLTQNWYNQIRENIPVFIEDTPKNKEIETVKNFLLEKQADLI